MTRDTLYERLGHFGVNVALIRKLDLPDDELAAFVDKLGKLIKSH